MRIKALWKGEEGFTIQELLVVIVVCSLLVSFGLSLFLFANKLFLSWREKSGLQRVVSSTLQAIVLDVLRSKQMTDVTDSSLVLRKDDGTEITYRFNGEHVWRNDILLDFQDGIKLAVIVSPGLESANQHEDADLLHIKVLGKSKASNFQTTTDVALPRSRQVEFLNSLTNPAEGGTKAHGDAN